MWQHRAIGRTLVFGHRGAMGYAPENTLVSFERAIGLGVDAVELDVHLTRDGELVVLHDPRLERTTSGRGLVRDHTLAEIRGLDAGSHFGPEFSDQRVPTLGEVLSLARGRCVVDIEIKGDPAPYPGVEERVVELIRSHDMIDQTIVISFEHPTAKQVKALAPEIAAGILYHCRPVDAVAMARAAGVEALLPHWSQCRSEDVDRAHDAGLSVHVWATSEPAEIRALLEMGVDSICSNHPDRVLAEVRGDH